MSVHHRHLKHTFLLIFGVVVVCAAPSVRADGIDIPILVAMGGMVLVPLLAFEVFAEGAVVTWGLRVPYRETPLNEA